MYREREIEREKKRKREKIERKQSFFHFLKKELAPKNEKNEIKKCPGTRDQGCGALVPWYQGSHLRHQYTWCASSCETEYVCGTCVDLMPLYLHDSRTLAEVERIPVVKCRDRVYKREFERLSGAYSYTNTHGVLVVVRQNMCVVPVWT